MIAPELILIVDDDDDMRDTVHALLELDGFKVIEARNARELYQQLQQHDVSLILLDIGLPESDGLSIMRELRPQYDIPVVMLTGKDDIIDKVVGLELGADDYITKPFHGRELTARLKTVLRRYNQPEATPAAIKQDRHVISFNGWKMDIYAHTLFNPDGVEVRMTSHEFSILNALIKSAGRVLTRDQLMEQINKGGRRWEPFDRSLDVMIAKIRKKLGETAKHPKFIRTIRQSGYMFIADIHEL